MMATGIFLHLAQLCIKTYENYIYIYIEALHRDRFDRNQFARNKIDTQQFNRDKVNRP